MMVRFADVLDAVLQLFYPLLCPGCERDLHRGGSCICLHCLDSLPATNFEKQRNNPVEKLFWGRIPLINAAASYFFSKESVVRRLMHHLKYKGNKDLGIQLGRLMGEKIKSSGYFNCDALIPLPLFPDKERQRGYNQSALLSSGMSEVLGIPVWDKIVTRPHFTQSQTKKGRVERWKNIEGKFQLADPAAIAGKHLLLVDDVVTTGATIESCAAELLSVTGTTVSIATLCVAMK